MNNRDKRRAELLALAESEGLTLPYPPDVILNFEDSGRYVDLITGMIGSDQERFSLTVIGEAEIIASKKG